MFYLDLAMHLKRTLVLPRTRLLRRISSRAAQFSPDAEYVAWGELFNVSTLSKLHPVIELDQFLELHGTVSMHYRIAHAGCSKSTGPTEVSFNGLAVSVGQSVCGPGLQYRRADLARGEYAQHESIAFSDSVDQLGMAQALPLRQYVRFEESVYDKAAAFVHREFGDAPFIAFHWRRTDFLQLRQSQKGALQSAHGVCLGLGMLINGLGDPGMGQLQQVGGASPKHHRDIAVNLPGHGVGSVEADVRVQHSLGHDFQLLV